MVQSGQELTAPSALALVESPGQQLLWIAKCLLPTMVPDPLSSRACATTLKNPSAPTKAFVIAVLAYARALLDTKGLPASVLLAQMTAPDTEPAAPTKTLHMTFPLLNLHKLLKVILLTPSSAR